MLNQLLFMIYVSPFDQFVIRFAITTNDVCLTFLRSDFMLTGDLSNGAIKRTTLCSLFIWLILSLAVCQWTHDSTLILKKPLKYFVPFFYAMYFLGIRKSPSAITSSHYYVMVNSTFLVPFNKLRPPVVRLPSVCHSVPLAFNGWLFFFFFGLVLTF